jgi:cystathionine beta-lyase/cystathionine gamma-synthase
VANLRLITSAVSLDHDESLIVHVGKAGRGGSECYPDVFREYGHLRLSIGLEDPADLIALHRGQASAQHLRQAPSIV